MCVACSLLVDVCSPPNAARRHAVAGRLSFQRLDRPYLRGETSGSPTMWLKLACYNRIPRACRCLDSARVCDLSRSAPPVGSDRTHSDSLYGLRVAARKTRHLGFDVCRRPHALAAFGYAGAAWSARTPACVRCADSADAASNSTAIRSATSRSGARSPVAATSGRSVGRTGMCTNGPVSCVL